MTGPSLAFLFITVLCFILCTSWAIGDSAFNLFDEGNGQSHSHSRREAADELATKIDRAITEMFECFNISTAMSVSVVKDGKLLLSKGYGRTRVKGGEPVSSKTRFAIGSLTKAFTSILIMKWILQNDNVELDTPIQKFCPEFRLADDLRSTQTSFRDLLAHRTGIGGDFFPLFWGFPKEVSRMELVKRMADIPASHQFRNKLHYNNYMYMVAANILERLLGNQTWEEMVRDQLLIPLNMSYTGFITEDNYDIPNFARGCAIVNDSYQDITPELLLGVVQCGPAGSIYSNSDDMATWIEFLLSGGKGPDEKYIIDPHAITGTWDPSMGYYYQAKLLSRDPLSFIIASYGLGWFLGNYRGYQHIFHSGGIVSYSSQLWLFPDIKAGVFLSVNGPQTEGANTNLIYNQTVLPTSYSPEIGSFVGNYSHDCFGTISIFQGPQDSDDKLRFEFGRFGKIELTRASNLTFQCKYYGPLDVYNTEQGLIPEKVTFLSDRMGGIGALLVSLGGVEPVRFECVQ
ncbi:penicillin-binding protein [Plakobranchus ocellatus]|uniref:Penicillin-binding protein n=1 Tax=Plakobranchus ocellatus TaxID=259542 RepID=A0AAV4ATF1_9GAST|nr:penicillin-binding protein [Plakobranchus ocellatus]